VASCIPVIGEVAAVVGIVIAIVSIFVHRDPPPSPAELMVENNCVPFVQGLSSPPQAWLDDQQKKDDHLNGSTTQSQGMDKQKKSEEEEEKD
jgi:hypothetical protein